MKSTVRAKTRSKRDWELRSEYQFDYSKARPNRLASRSQQGSVAVLLEPDVARVFKNADSANAVLRALMITMPARRMPADK